eukprot:gene10038-13496_t
MDGVESFMKNSNNHLKLPVLLKAHEILSVVQLNNGCITTDDVIHIFSDGLSQQSLNSIEKNVYISLILESVLVPIIGFNNSLQLVMKEDKVNNEFNFISGVLSYIKGKCGGNELLYQPLVSFQQEANHYFTYASENALQSVVPPLGRPQGYSPSISNYKRMEVLPVGNALVQPPSNPRSRSAQYKQAHMPPMHQQQYGRYSNPRSSEVDVPQSNFYGVSKPSNNYFPNSNNSHFAGGNRFLGSGYLPPSAFHQQNYPNPGHQPQQPDMNRQRSSRASGIGNEDFHYNQNFSSYNKDRDKEKSEVITRLLALLRKAGMDILFPQNTHDKILACIYSAVNQHSTPAHRDLIDMVMAVKDSDSSLSQLKSISKTKIRGVLALLKHGDLLSTTGGINEGTPVKLLLNSTILSFRDFREQHDFFLMKYISEQKLHIPDVFKPELIWYYDDSTRAQCASNMEAFIDTLNDFFNRLKESSQQTVGIPIHPFEAAALNDKNRSYGTTSSLHPLNNILLPRGIPQALTQQGPYSNPPNYNKGPQTTYSNSHLYPAVPTVPGIPPYLPERNFNISSLNESLRSMEEIDPTAHRATDNSSNKSSPYDLFHHNTANNSSQQSEREPDLNNIPKEYLHPQSKVQINNYGAFNLPQHNDNTAATAAITTSENDTKYFIPRTLQIRHTKKDEVESVKNFNNDNMIDLNNSIKPVGYPYQYPSSINNNEIYNARKDESLYDNRTYEGSDEKTTSVQTSSSDSSRTQPASSMQNFLFSSANNDNASSSLSLSSLSLLPKSLQNSMVKQTDDNNTTDNDLNLIYKNNYNNNINNYDYNNNWNDPTAYSQLNFDMNYASNNNYQSYVPSSDYVQPNMVRDYEPNSSPVLTQNSPSIAMFNVGNAITASDSSSNNSLASVN